MTDRHPHPDELVALALAEVGPEAQERLVAHLAGCPACRDDYAECSDGLAQALAAAPAVAPPAGFSGRVLAAMGTTQSVAPLDAVTAPRPRRRTVLLMAAAVLLGLLAGIGGTLATTAWLERPAATDQRLPVAAPLLTAKGEAVGSVGLATLNGRSYLLLNVTTGRPGATYECILVGRDGQRTSGGSWTLTQEYGTGSASGAWLVPLSGEPPAGVELVAPSGTVWSQGRF